MFILGVMPYTSAAIQAIAPSLICWQGWYTKPISPCIFLAQGACVCVCAPLCVRVCTCLCARACVCAPVCMCVCVCMCVRACVCMYLVLYSIITLYTSQYFIFYYLKTMCCQYYITSNLKSFICTPNQQASSSFKFLDMCMTPMHTIPIFITKAFCLIACLQLFEMTIVKCKAYAVLAYSYQVGFVTVL